jgi:hypothetical protein
MKRPAVAIATALASGIVAGPEITPKINSAKPQTPQDQQSNQQQ